MAHGQRSENNSGNIFVQHVRLEDIEDDIEPPPLNLTSKCKNLQDWLRNICESDRPKKIMAKYKFGLFESPNDYTLVLIGVNTYDEGENRSVTRIEFKPADMYLNFQKHSLKT